MAKEIITGFFEIEDILNKDNGSGKLIALASRPGMGKSTFMHHLLSRMVSLNESNVLLFSLEMSKKQKINAKIIVFIAIRYQKELNDKHWGKKSPSHPEFHLFNFL